MGRPDRMGAEAAAALVMDEDYQAKFDSVRASKREYWRALGEFVDNFARAEVILKRFLIRLLDLDTAVGLVVTAGLRADTLATYILRVNDLKPRPGFDPAFVREAVERFAAINTVRNAILHSGAVMKDEKLIVTNFLTARTPAHKHEFAVKPEPLEEMSYDLSKIIGHFIVFAAPRPAVIIPKVQHLLERQWRSRPAELLNRSPKNQKVEAPAKQERP
jgi:hypothetical protein